MHRDSAKKQGVVALPGCIVICGVRATPSLPFAKALGFADSADQQHAQRKEDGALHSGASLGALPYAYVKRHLQEQHSPATPCIPIIAGMHCC